MLLFKKEKYCYHLFVISVNKILTFIYSLSNNHSNSIVFSNNHILYKTPEFYEDAPAYLEDKTCLDLPFDIGHQLC